MVIKKINMMFLVTVLISFFAAFLPISQMFPDYGARLLFSEKKLFPRRFFIFPACLRIVIWGGLKKLANSPLSYYRAAVVFGNSACCARCNLDFCGKAQLCADRAAEKNTWQYRGAACTV